MTCLECGFRYGLVDPDEIGGKLRSLGPSFAGALDGVDPVTASRRPAPSVWSALEYTCHVRDVLLVQRDRAVLAQVENTPSFARMHRDERVALCHYDAHPVAAVLDQLAMAAELCATVFDGLDQAAWARRLVYNWPEATEHDLAWLGRHTLHEGHHHLMDVRRVLVAP
jgi:DNA segregation ATPase FtsK/SpoIIIE, S-DNA-T family